MAYESEFRRDTAPSAPQFLVRWLLGLACLILAFMVPSGLVLLLPIAVFGVAGLIDHWRSARVWRRQLRDELENWEQHVGI